MFELVLHGFLCCDRVITERNGKKGLIGVFQSLHVPNTVGNDLLWYIYIALGSVTRGTHPFVLTIIHSQTSVEVVSRSGKIRVKRERENVELVLPINCKFSHYGAYVMTLEVAGELIASRILRIELTKTRSYIET